MNMPDRVHYGKLPGRRRGILFGSSVWLGPDHLLLVKSARFREEYRRFYFSEIQAIVTADAPRFHISTRSATIGALWASLYLVLWAVQQALAAREIVVHLTWIGWGVLAALAIAWVYISGYYSCRCRIYTAVSAEELPSVYRTWTAKKFLDAVQPYIAQSQGVLQGSWAEAVEDRQVGPLHEARASVAPPFATSPALSVPPQGRDARTTGSIFLVGSLLLGGLAQLATIESGAGVGRWILLSFLLLQLIGAVAVLIENFKGKLSSAVRNLAIVLLVAMGAWYYAVQIGGGIVTAYEAAQSKKPRPIVQQMQPLALLYAPLSRGIVGGLDLVLGIAGLILLARGGRNEANAAVDLSA